MRAAAARRSAALFAMERVMTTEEPDGLSEDDLEQIEQRIRSATAPPWFSWVAGRNLEAGSNCIELGSLETIELRGGTVADQDFIAYAREDLPRLLREVRALRAACAQLSVPSIATRVSAALQVATWKSPSA